MSIREQEQFWDSMAVGNSDAGVIDPADKKNHKNSYICHLRNHYFYEELGTPSSSALFLDFGCGTGLVTEALVNKGYSTIGVDISEKLLAYGKAARPDLDLVKIDGETLPFKNGTFDEILIYVVLNYVDDDIALSDLFKEMHRILQPGGRIIAIEQTVKKREFIQTEHKTLRTRNEYSALFESCDFVLLKQKTVRFGRFPTTYLVRYGWFPRIFWSGLRQLEALAGRFFPSSPFSYTDTLFVAEKHTSD